MAHIVANETTWINRLEFRSSFRGGLWEVRSSLASNRIARVLFSFTQGRIVALHGFIKKTQKTPDADLSLARKRMNEFE